MASKKTTKKQAPKKVAGKKPAAKKVAPKKVAPKKAAPKKAAPKKVAPKKAAPKKVAPKTAKASHTVPSLALDRALKAVELQGVMQRLSPPVAPMVTVLRRVLLDSAPEAIELLERDNPAYDAHGVFARLEPGMNEVAVRFLRGGSLASAATLLGDGNARLMRITSIDQIDLDLLQRLVREAVALNMAIGRG